MERETAAFKKKTLIFSETREHAVQSELLLPDYYPEVEKVLHCSAVLSEESVSLQADRVCVAGSACFTVLYTAADRQIRSFSGTEKYTKLIPCCETAPGDVCIVRQTPAQVNCRATAPRRIEIGAAAAVKAEIWRLGETEALCAARAPGLETLTEETDHFCIHAFGDLPLETSGTIRLPVPRENVAAVLHENAVFRCSEISAIGNRLLLRGTAHVTLSLVTDEGAVHAGLHFQLPVTQTKDLFGAEENDVCFACPGSPEAELNLKAALGEKEAAELTVRLRCTVLAGKPEKRVFLRDAYALHGSVKTTAEKAEIPCGASPVETPFPFEAQAECYDDTAETVLNAFISDLRYSVSVREGVLSVSGSAAANALVKSRAGGFGFVSRTCPFSFEAPLPQGTRACCGVRVNELSAAFAGKGLIRFNGEFCMQGFRVQTREETVLTALEFSEAPAKAAREKIVVYYAAAGERVWEIAKENKSSVSLISEQNGLKGDTLEENAVLVFTAY